ncbi:membrane hypothetical protein [Candidatus Terasakiella magnetica]|uniref:Uncharacterized protein n=1 Tax=Candidatus Terasakiella magnetica TaxID=1867952 RepID=A0A1C3RHM9_9PROT|nr:hypothetical protein [Candidatus Terasakiella magnetica]SCA56781.1 membrane hypothetical protein [Candidatus Terasakiella magnetica]
MMQFLFALSFALMVAASLFIGNALSGGYAPYMGFGASALLLLALFMPFMSEYNVLHRGFSKIGDNFKTLMKSETHEKGDVEILVPGQSHALEEAIAIEKKQKLPVGMMVIVVLSIILLGADAVNFYLLGDGLKTDTGPISNF